jgi:hypothetical protein
MLNNEAKALALGRGNSYLGQAHLQGHCITVYWPILRLTMKRGQFMITHGLCNRSMEGEERTKNPLVELSIIRSLPIS